MRSKNDKHKMKPVQWQNDVKQSPWHYQVGPMMGGWQRQPEPNNIHNYKPSFLRKADERSLISAAGVPDRHSGYAHHGYGHQGNRPPAGRPISSQYSPGGGHGPHVPPVQMYQYWYTYPNNQFDTDDLPSELTEQQPALAKKKKQRKKLHPIATTKTQYKPHRWTFQEMVSETFDRV